MCIYIYREREREIHTYIYIYIYTIPANLRAKILDFGGFYSSRMMSFRAGIPMSIGNSPEMLSQAILAGIILVVGRLGISYVACGACLRCALTRCVACSVNGVQDPPYESCADFLATWYVCDIIY